jgi:hypothetical protein
MMILKSCCEAAKVMYTYISPVNLCTLMEQLKEEHNFYVFSIISSMYFQCYFREQTSGATFLTITAALPGHTQS